MTLTFARRKQRLTEAEMLYARNSLEGDWKIVAAICCCNAISGAMRVCAQFRRVIRSPIGGGEYGDKDDR
jgi:hypothetical protein